MFWHVLTSGRSCSKIFEQPDIMIYLRSPIFRVSHDFSRFQRDACCCFVFFFCSGKKWQEAKAFHYFWLNHLQVVFPGTVDFIAACSAETASCDWVNSPWRLHEQESFLALEEVEKKQRCASKVEWFQLDFLSYFTVFFPKVKFLRIRHGIFEAKFYLIVTLSEFLPRAISDSLNY